MDRRHRPGAGELGGHVIYSGPADGLALVEESQTRNYLFAKHAINKRVTRKPKGWLRLAGVTRNNLKELNVEFPIGAFTTVTGVSGSGKSSLVSQVLVELVSKKLGNPITVAEDEGEELERQKILTLGGEIVGGMEHLRRLVLWIRKRSVVPLVRISPLTPDYSTTFANCLLRLKLHAHVNMMQVVSPLM